MKDFFQKTVRKLTFTSVVTIEIYRAVTGSLLVVFAPAQCNDHKCTAIENYLRGDIVFRVGFLLNFLLLFVLSFMYGFEVTREVILRKSMYSNKNSMVDTLSVGNVLLLLPKYKQEKIEYYHLMLRYISNLAIFFYILNTIVSTFLIGVAYMNKIEQTDEKTATAFITNTLFLGSKIYQVYLTVTPEKNIFLSSYTSEKIQFNAIKESAREFSAARTNLLHTIEHQVIPID